MGALKESVRSADVASTLKRLPHRKYSTSLKSIEISGASIPEDFSVRLGNGIAVIAGGNGAGKSSLLRAIRACLDAEVELSREAPGWFSKIDEINVRWSNDTGNEESLVSTLKLGRHDQSQTRTTRSGHRPENVYFIDAAAETGGILSMLQDDPNYRDLLEGVDPAPADSTWLMYASYILNRTYDSVDIYEITTTNENDIAVPYFEVRTMGAHYSALDMGRGELSALYLLWRLSQIPDGSVVILEEPETHLAVLSQRKLTEAIATISLQRDISMILSTHSPGVFDILPHGQVSLVGALPVLSVLSGLDSRALASKLGMPRRFRRVAITEDLFAAQLLEMIIWHTDRSLMESISIAYSKDGESGVLTVLDGLRAYRYAGPGGAPVELVGILDGDQRSVQQREAVSFLPGSEAPEIVVRERLVNWLSGDETFTDFGESVSTRLREALIASQGLDHHDWLVGVCREFGGGAAFLDRVSSFLFQDAAFAAQADTVVRFLQRP